MRSELTLKYMLYLSFLVLILQGRTIATDVKVTISAGFYGAYEQLAPVFKSSLGDKLIAIRVPWIGDSPEAIRFLSSSIAREVIINTGLLPNKPPK